MKTAAIYARVSTQAQADSGTSLTTQLEACRHYATSHGYLVVAEEAEDVSGATLRRPGLDRIRELTAQGHVNAVLVYALDRLARETGDTLALLKEFKGVDCELVTVSAPLEDSPSGKMLLTMLAAIAEYERCLIVERTRRGKERRARDGRYMRTVHIPYGYLYNEETRCLEIDESKAQWVRQIYEWMASDGCSIYEIVLRLAARGVSAPTRSMWSRTTIHRILTSPTYTGTWHYNKVQRRAADRKAHLTTRKHASHQVDKPREEWIAVSIPAIVSQLQFDAVQKQLVRNAEQSRRNNKCFQYLLAGLIRCSVCNCKFVGGHVNAARGKTGYYTCRRRVARELKREFRCRTHSIRQLDFEELIWSEVVRQLSDRDLIEKAMRDQVQQVDTRVEEHIRSLQKDRLKIEEESERLLDLYQIGDIDRETWQKRMDAIRKRLSTLEGELAQALAEQRTQQTVHSGKDWFSIVERVQANLPFMIWEERRAFLVGMGVGITSDGVTAQLTGLPEEVTLQVPFKKRMPFRDTPPSQTNDLAWSDAA